MPRPPDDARPPRDARPSRDGTPVTERPPFTDDTPRRTDSRTDSRVTQTTGPSVFSNALDLADSTVRFGFLFLTEILEVAADMAKSEERSLPEPSRPYGRRNIEARVNEGLTNMTRTLDELCGVLED